MKFTKFVRFFESILSVFIFVINDFLTRIKKTEVQYFIMYVIFFVTYTLILIMYLQYDLNSEDVVFVQEVNVPAMLENIKIYQENQHCLEEKLTQLENEITRQIAMLEYLKWRNMIIGISLFVGSALIYIYFPEISHQVVSIFSGHPDESSMTIPETASQLGSQVDVSDKDITLRQSVVNHMTEARQMIEKTLIPMRKYCKTHDYCPRYNYTIIHSYKTYSDVLDGYEEALDFQSIVCVYTPIDLLKGFLEGMRSDIIEMKAIISDPELNYYMDQLKMHIENNYTLTGRNYVSNTQPGMLHDLRILDLHDSIEERFYELTKDSDLLTLDKQNQIRLHQKPNDPDYPARIEYYIKKAYGLL